MEASHKTHRPHIKVGKDEEEEEEDSGTTEASCCTKGWSYPAVTWSILSTIYYANVKRLTPSVGNSSGARCVQQTYPWNWSEILLGGDTYSNGNEH